jgi:cytochrome c oxidase cbb3-type subunit III
MAKATDVLLDHEVDGIKEFDNPLPAWWLGILYVTIVFTLIFIPYLYVTGWSSAGQYEDEMAAADEKYGDPGEAAAEAMASWEPTSADIAAGKAVFTRNCVACHAADGTGGIGPNLTDAEWIHGGTMADIQKTVFAGVPEKGMLTWGPVIGQEKVNQVSAYIHTLGGGQ